MTQHERFPFLLALEAQWEDVLEELNNLLYNEVENHVNYFVPWHETELYDGSWDVFGLYSFGDKLESNCNRCPKTTALVESVPGLTTAGFSALAPETYIKPHVGYTSDVLRCHLGLIVPDLIAEYSQRSMPLLSSDTCGMMVDDEFYYWEPGKAFVFDDTLEHSAWNWGNRTRYVLLLDFKRPEQPEESDLPPE